MTDHDGGWPDHHDDPGFSHEPDGGELFGDDPLAHQDQELHGLDDLWQHDEPPAHDDIPDHDAGQPDVEHTAPDEQPAVEVHELGAVGADPDALPEPDAAEALSLFPPVVDVGPLPEPVDGFPWIDTGSLGLVDPAAVHLPAGAPEPQELAEYAAEDLPPGADPWATLAESEDPATSALAKWWSPNG